APDMDLYKPRKRKRAEKNPEEQGPKKKEIKKEGVTTSEKLKEDTAVKEKDRKRQSSGVKIDEGRSKLKHDKRSK
ncbi:hypothetical protein A2U01_0102230, partial [Trifolium medium]|nr:hypothetical protein [Trifolium medium]